MGTEPVEDVELDSNGYQILDSNNLAIQSS